MSHPSATPPIRSLNLNGEQLTEILSRMDQWNEVQVEKFSARRKHARRNMRAVGVFVVLPESSATAAFAVPIRNISKGGVSFLHRAMLYPRSAVAIKIRLESGTWLDAIGKVVRCRHVDGLVHEIGLRFDDEIALEEQRK